MTKSEQINFLIDILLSEMPEIKSQAEKVPDDLQSQRQLLRALMNIRPPMLLKSSFLKIQDELLQNETIEKGIVSLDEIENPFRITHSAFRIKLWQGDITRLKVDAIVNAANSALLGCFVPLHNCIDNAIHSAAGLQLRDTCAKIMQTQGHEEKTGQAKITPAFNLPSQYVIHTVGPIIPANREPNLEEENLLASCYKSCLELAVENKIKSIAFCCISTGEFHFPNRRAAEIAIKTVLDFTKENDCDIIVVFNTFKEVDTNIYKELFTIRNEEL